MGAAAMTLEQALQAALRYDPLADQFTYNWKTVATWGSIATQPS